MIMDVIIFLRQILRGEGERGGRREGGMSGSVGTLKRLHLGSPAQRRSADLNVVTTGRRCADNIRKGVVRDLIAAHRLTILHWC